MSLESPLLHYFRFSNLLDDLSAYSALLSQAEKERAARFHFERDRHCFILARGKLREVLAEHLGTNPKALRFEYGAHGKPYLFDHALEFNLSHTTSAFLIALADRPVGVDLEDASRDLDPLALGERMMSPAEKTYFETASLERQKEAFLRAWVRKEALLKATGLGIGVDLQSLTVTPDGESTHDVLYDGHHWTVCDLLSRDEHHLAYAVRD